VKRGDATMFLIMLVLYGLQLANSIKLDAAPRDVSRVSDQGLLAIAFFLFGIARAWQLVGAREFNLMATAAMIHRPGGESMHRADGEQPGRAGRGEP
jgi:hypothetical protein